ncbi:DNA-methyltransferase [Brevibacillus sp. NRS-1366]|uniref:DNA-methyltransferase n=1 Tax=Brevibacillus sp. NRS-1366 TaxID=3233899 RepID=UPI003D21C816
MINTIIHGDGLKVMGDIEDGSVDMILCDLPFGTTQSPWDTVIPYDPLWLQYERIIKDNGAIVLFAKSPFDKTLATSNMKLYRYEWIWEKNKATGHLNAGKMPMQAHENILVFYKKPPTYNPQMTDGHRPMNYAVKNNNTTVYGTAKCVPNNAGTTERHPRTVLRYPVVNNDSAERIHPNQKPVELLEYLIKTYTIPGELILDNCSGSAATAEAAIRTHRNYICIEQEWHYVQKSRDRIKNLVIQESLSI